jgi:hypothetical protein
LDGQEKDLCKGLIAGRTTARQEFYNLPSARCGELVYYSFGLINIGDLPSVIIVLVFGDLASSRKASMLCHSIIFLFKPSEIIFCASRIPSASIFLRSASRFSRSQ